MDDATSPDSDSAFFALEAFVLAAMDVVDTTFKKIDAASERLNRLEHDGAHHVQHNMIITAAPFDYVMLNHGPLSPQDSFIGLHDLRRRGPKTAGPDIHYTLGLSERGLADYDDLMPFVIAHEIKHATLMHSQHNGTPNIHGLKIMTTILSSLFHDENPCIREDGVAGLFAKTMQAVTSLAVLPGRALSRFEENCCDDFALRVYPDVDLDAFADYLHTYPDRSAKAHLFSTHPPIDVRIARLRRKQDRLLASL